jgi:hypothetical protein
VAKKATMQAVDRFLFFLQVFTKVLQRSADTTFKRQVIAAFCHFRQQLAGSSLS